MQSNNLNKLRLYNIEFKKENYTIDVPNFDKTRLNNYYNRGDMMKIGASMLATEDRTIEEALEYFEEAIALNPNYTLAYFNAGRASQEMGFTNDAANYYQMAIDLNRITEELEEEDIRARLHSLFEL